MKRWVPLKKRKKRKKRKKHKKSLRSNNQKNLPLFLNFWRISFGRRNLESFSQQRSSLSAAEFHWWKRKEKRSHFDFCFDLFFVFVLLTRWIASLFNLETIWRQSGDFLPHPDCLILLFNPFVLLLLFRILRAANHKSSSLLYLFPSSWSFTFTSTFSLILKNLSFLNLKISSIQIQGVIPLHWVTSPVKEEPVFNYLMKRWRAVVSRERKEKRKKGKSEKGEERKGGKE